MEVTRKEFDELNGRVTEMLDIMGNMATNAKFASESGLKMAKIVRDASDVALALKARLSRVESLADGVKDGLLCLSFRAKVAGSISDATHTEVCDHVSAAQQPAPSAEGAGVDLAASKGATTNERAVEGAPVSPYFANDN